MSTTQLLLTLTGWYGAGFGGARIMVLRGHAPAPWIFAAWIAGALTLLVALAWPWLRTLAPRAPAGDPHPDDPLARGRDRPSARAGEDPPAPSRETAPHR